MVAVLSLLCTSCGQAEATGDAVNASPETSQLKAICELATMDCYYHNVAKYTEEDATGIWLWKKDKRFWIEYSGVVTVGIDASKLQMEVSDNVVTITIPEARVLSSKVDPDSLTDSSFYIDKDSADVEAADQTAAYSEAEESMTEKASSDTALLTNAQQSAQTLIEDYVNNIGDAVGIDYKICWVYLDAEDSSAEDSSTEE